MAGPYTVNATVPARITRLVKPAKNKLKILIIKKLIYKYISFCNNLMLPPYLEPAGGRAGRTTQGRKVGAKVEPCQLEVLIGRST